MSSVTLSKPPSIIPIILTRDGIITDQGGINHGFPTLKYFCMSDEIGIEGTYHTHFYCVFSSRVRFSTIKKHFPEAHIEAAHGSVQSNIDYIRKSGKWADTEKSETCVEGTFEEWGTIPIQKGKDKTWRNFMNWSKPDIAMRRFLL